MCCQPTGLILGSLLSNFTPSRVNSLESMLQLVQKDADRLSSEVSEADIRAADAESRAVEAEKQLAEVMARCDDLSFSLARAEAKNEVGGGVKNGG